MTVFIFIIQKIITPFGEEKEKNMDKKVTGIVSYLTWVGWLVAFLAGDKEGAKFHLNQSLCLNLVALVNSVIACIPFIGTIISLIVGLVVFVFWCMGFYYAIIDVEKEVPLIGKIQLLK